MKTLKSSTLGIIKFLFSFCIVYLCSCATTRPYPLCFCNETPTSAQYKTIEKDISQILLSYMNSKNQVVFSSDRRWVFAKVTNHKNKAIEKIWPRVACIGKKDDDRQLEINKRCIEYIRSMLKDHKYDISEDKRKGYLYCGGNPY